MKLSEHLKLVKKSPEQFGLEIEVSGQAVRRYLDGTRFPRPEVLRRIAKVTKHKVTADDFLEVAPKKRARPLESRVA